MREVSGTLVRIHSDGRREIMTASGRRTFIRFFHCPGCGQTKCEALFRRRAEPVGDGPRSEYHALCSACESPNVVAPLDNPVQPIVCNSQFG